MAVFRFVYSGDNKDDVVREVEPVLGPRLGFLAARASISGNDSLHGLTVREYLDRVTVYGSPDDIAGQVLTDPAIAGLASDFVANFSYADDFDPDNAKARLDVLAGQIEPALGWRPRAATSGVAS